MASWTTSNSQKCNKENTAINTTMVTSIAYIPVLLTYPPALISNHDNVAHHHDYHDSSMAPRMHENSPKHY